MVERSIISEVANDIERGKGCSISERLNLLGFTDRINVLKEANQVVRDKSQSSVTSSILERIAHLDVSSSVPSSWFSKYLYHEDYSARYNSSKITCSDYNMRSGELLKTRSFDSKYETKFE